MVVSPFDIIVVVFATAARHCQGTVARWEWAVLPNDDNDPGKTTRIMFGQQQQEARAAGGQLGAQSTLGGPAQKM